MTDHIKYFKDGKFFVTMYVNWTFSFFVSKYLQEIEREIILKSIIKIVLGRCFKFNVNILGSLLYCTILMGTGIKSRLLSTQRNLLTTIYDICSKTILTTEAVDKKQNKNMSPTCNWSQYLKQVLCSNSNLNFVCSM